MASIGMAFIPIWQLVKKILDQCRRITWYCKHLLAYRIRKSLLLTYSYANYSRMLQKLTEISTVLKREPICIYDFDYLTLRRRFFPWRHCLLNKYELYLYHCKTELYALGRIITSLTQLTTHRLFSRVHIRPLNYWGIVHTQQDVGRGINMHTTIQFCFR
jgi:hypothetical protein